MKYIIENEYLKAEISELGATLTKFISKKSMTDIVLGFDSDEDYLKYAGTNIGATIGRNANRIGNASFGLNGKRYQLSINDNMNQLHGGGVNGFAFKMWKAESVREDEIVLSYFSEDGEEGFPGNLYTKVCYKLDKDSLIFSFEGESDEDTLFNITNHSYFNLGGEDIMEHSLHLTTDRYSPVDEYSLTLDEVRKTDGTPYDFNEFRKLKDNLSQLKAGIDNNYVWEDMSEKLMAELKNDRLQLNVYSDLPDMHVYTAYYLNGEKGKYGRTYHRAGAICLECQYYPNSINYGDHYLLPILRKGETMKHHIRFELIDLEESKMELNELVAKRRSVRKYGEVKPSKEDIEEIIRCAQLAPSWKNSQTGRYYVALSEEAIKTVFEALPDFNQHSTVNAAYIIATFKEKLSGAVREGQMSEEGDLWGAYDLGLQNAYLLLKACELGYDTLIMGLRDTASLREYFSIPEDEIIMPVIAIGKRDGDVNFRPRKPIEEILKIG